MWWTMTVLFLALWGLGLVSGATLGWWIHLLLVLALGSLVMSVITTKATLARRG
jgi:hypothetical protein